MFFDFRNNQDPVTSYVAGEVEITENDPIIGASSIIDRGNISASSQATFSPAVNLSNPSTYLKWVAAAAGDAFIKVETGGKPVNFIGIARHNLGTIAATLSVVGTIAGADIDLTGDIVIASNDAIFIRFDDAEYSELTVHIRGGTAPASIAVMQAGTVLVIPNGINTGFTPLRYGRKTEFATGRSQSGEFLGRIITSESLTTSIPFQYLDGDWYRAKLAPLILSFRLLPFFFAWAPKAYPEEAGMCWLTNSPRPSIDTEEGLINVSFEVEGLGI